MSKNIDAFNDKDRLIQIHIYSIDTIFEPNNLEKNKTQVDLLKNREETQKTFNDSINKISEIKDSKKIINEIKEISTPDDFIQNIINLQNEILRFKYYTSEFISKGTDLDIQKIPDFISNLANSYYKKSDKRIQNEIKFISSIFENYMKKLEIYEIVSKNGIENSIDKNSKDKELIRRNLENFINNYDKNKEKEGLKNHISNLISKYKTLIENNFESYQNLNKIKCKFGKIIENNLDVIEECIQEKTNANINEKKELVSLFTYNLANTIKNATHHSKKDLVGSIIESSNTIINTLDGLSFEDAKIRINVLKDNNYKNLCGINPYFIDPKKISSRKNKNYSINIQKLVNENLKKICKKPEELIYRSKIASTIASIYAIESFEKKNVTFEDAFIKGANAAILFSKGYSIQELNKWSKKFDEIYFNKNSIVSYANKIAREELK